MLRLLIYISHWGDDRDRTGDLVCGGLFHCLFHLCNLVWEDGGAPVGLHLLLQLFCTSSNGSPSNVEAKGQQYLARNRESQVW